VSQAPFLDERSVVVPALRELQRAHVGLGPRTGSHHGHQTFDNISVLDMLQSRPPLHYKANASMSL
jgi:hypothetical protein